MKKSVTIIGNGIAGLMCAFKFNENGYHVKVICKSPEILNSDSDIENYSTTMNGVVGRLFSTFEGQTYLGSDEMYPNMIDAFQSNVSKGGWLGKKSSDFRKYEMEWLKNRVQATNHSDKVEERFSFFVEANKFSINQWSQISKKFDFLFKKTDFIDDKILRLYHAKDQLDFAIGLHKKQDVLKSILTKEEIVNKYPLFSHGVKSDYLIGGVEVRGQSINIKQFVLNLSNYLKSNGVEFNHNTEIKKIDKNSKNQIVSISSNSQTFTDNNFIFCTGIYHKVKLFSELYESNKFGSISGLWFLIPSTHDFHTPTKIHIQTKKQSGGLFPVVDFNFTPYKDYSNQKDMIAIGAGYVYAGNFPFQNINKEMSYALELNKEALRNTIGQIYNNHFENGDIVFSDSICHRSFSVDDKPAFDEFQLENGGKAIITGGANTGTATMSPFIAKTVYNIIDGSCHEKF